MSKRQLAFDLEPRPALGRDDFLVAPCNAEAVAWIDKFPDWPHAVTILSGAPGAGKTHLTKVFMAASGATELAAATLGQDRTPVFPDAPAVIIDAADTRIGDPAAEEALFHLYNQAVERGAGLLLNGRTPAARWPIALPDLSSRLKAAPALEIGAPDDALLSAVLVKLFNDRQLAIDPDVLSYVIPRIERSFEAARTFVADADRLALEAKRRITVPLARTVLNG